MSLPNIILIITDQQRADQRRQPPAPDRQRRQRDEGDHHRRGDRGIAVQRPHQIEAEAQKDARHHAHHDRHRQRRHQALDPTAHSQQQHQQAGGIEGADHLGKAQVLQRRPNQHGAGNGPGKAQRHVVEPAHRQRQQAVDEEDTEDPGRQLGRTQPAARANRQDDRDRPGGREDGH